MKDGSIRVLGEAIWQYEGLAPDDKRLERFWSLAEELDLPIAIHLGGGPPRIQREMPFRMRFNDPLALEDIPVRHPRLRLWVMHAGYPMLVDAGFTRNIMYGSDQAVWPSIIPYSIEAIESADFLSPEQRRAILCGNAARFLRLDPTLCEG